MDGHATARYRKAGRALLAWLLSPVVDGLAAVGVTANDVTIVSLFAGLVAGAALAFDPVSYTHLDVYKRQNLERVLARAWCPRG